jgi:hypothetical protein
MFALTVLVVLISALVSPGGANIRPVSTSQLGSACGQGTSSLVHFTMTLYIDSACEGGRQSRLSAGGNEAPNAYKRFA